jgi:MSHA biogenesis protein MshO
VTGSERSGGFTLIEAIVSISILAILAALGGIFVVPAINAYFDQQRRAGLSDVADSALRRMSRDVRLALPNSVRVATAGSQYLELLQTRTGGRYRSQNDDGTAAGEDPLDFTVADGIFDTVGRLPALVNQVIVPGSDRVAVHNLGLPGANAYNGDNTSLITAFAAAGGAAADEDRITILPWQFPLESPGRRFQVISGPVTYECTAGGPNANGDGTGTLRRYDGYVIAAAQPTPPAGTPTLLAGFVTACGFEYGTLPLQGRGVVAVRIGVTRGGETVSLYQEIHVNNVP